MSLIKEINQKVNREVNSMKEDFKSKLKEVMSEVRENERKWENEFGKMKMKWENDRKKAKEVLQEHTRNIDGRGVDKRDEMSEIEYAIIENEKEGEETEWKAKIEENHRNIALLYEKIDDSKIKWKRDFVEWQVEIKERMDKSCENIVSNIEPRLKRIEEYMLRSSQENILVMDDKGNEEKEKSVSARTSSEIMLDQNTIQELHMPKFNNQENENPRKFIEEF